MSKLFITMIFVKIATKPLFLEDQRCMVNKVSMLNYGALPGIAMPLQFISEEFQNHNYAWKYKKKMIRKNDCFPLNRTTETFLLFILSFWEKQITGLEGKIRDIWSILHPWDRTCCYSDIILRCLPGLSSENFSDGAFLKAMYFSASK